MKRFKKIYLEISNICNLSCAFCAGTKRAPRIMSKGEFDFVLQHIKPYTDYIYFHLMGEPLCHPHLENLLERAADAGFKVILTTNGTLLCKKQNALLASSGLHKVNISLHAFEANDIAMPFSEYLDRCLSFGRAAQGKKIIVYRLWNSGGANERNSEILAALQKYFPKPWAEERNGIRIGEKVYLEYGEKFDWPSLDAADFGEKTFCMGLRDQIGILADGTVVPCCLDHDGDIALGNIFESDLGGIIGSERAVSILDGFSHSVAKEELCRRCGFAHMKFKV